MSTNLSTGLSVRQASRAQTLTTPTPGLALNFLQANLLVLPSKYAADFRSLCFRNPVTCPLLGESVSKGEYGRVKSYLPKGKLVEENRQGKEGEEGEALDLRKDCPRYFVYQDGKLVSGKEGERSIENFWTGDHVAFLVGCSFSFEAGLAEEEDEGRLTPRHVLMGRNVPMYRTKIPLCSAGVFVGGTCVVSMRPYKLVDLERVRDVTRKYAVTHGEPIAWGWDAVGRLGIGDIDQPEWGDAPLSLDGRRFGEMEGGEEVPVFWGCGITTQEAVMAAELQGTVMAHAPGHMLVLDCKDEDIFTD